MDTSVHSGVRSDYDISLISSGAELRFRIVDLRANALVNQGDDIVDGVERFEFADGTIMAANLLEGNGIHRRASACQERL